MCVRVMVLCSSDIMRGCIMPSCIVRKPGSSPAGSGPVFEGFAPQRKQLYTPSPRMWRLRVASGECPAWAQKGQLMERFFIAAPPDYCAESRVGKAKAERDRMHL